MRQPTSDEIEAHEEERHPGPTAEDFRINWMGGKLCVWNADAFEIFLTVVEEEQAKKRNRNPEYAAIPESEIENVFYERVRKLLAIIKRARPRDLGNGVMETAATVAKRIRSDRKKKAGLQRPLTRRGQVRKLYASSSFC
jgi:hypothetical protein